MFIHFYTHDILIFVQNCDKNSLNIIVPCVIGLSVNAFNWFFLPNPFLQKKNEFPTTIPTKISMILFTFQVSKLQNQLY